jgi:hypothetical protein
MVSHMDIHCNMVMMTEVSRHNMGKKVNRDILANKRNLVNNDLNTLHS